MYTEGPEDPCEECKRGEGRKFQSTVASEEFISEIACCNFDILQITT
jgi:hypothetical protein